MTPEPQNYVSEIVWAVIAIVAFTWEMVGVKTEHQTGYEPLTRIVRDRWMRKTHLVYFGVVAFWLWLGVHFFLGWT